jgi:hypothetical protein
VGCRDTPVVLKDYSVPLASNRMKEWKNNSYMKNVTFVTSDFR